MFIAKDKFEALVLVGNIMAELCRSKGLNCTPAGWDEALAAIRNPKKEAPHE